MIINKKFNNFSFYYDFKISFWEYSFIVNKHNEKPTDMFRELGNIPVLNDKFIRVDNGTEISLFLL